MYRDVLKRVSAACLSGGLILSVCGAAWAEDPGRPAIVKEIEDRYDGFFLLTTADGRDYDIYQRIESGQGLATDSDVVCMLNECLLDIASMPEAVVARYSDGTSNLGGLRQRLTGVRDAYSAMGLAPPGDKPAAVESWHEAVARLTRCLKTAEECQ